LSDEFNLVSNWFDGPPTLHEDQQRKHVFSEMGHCIETSVHGIKYGA